MENCLQKCIPNGYIIEQRLINVDIDSAVEILKSRKRRKIISAYRKDYDLFAELRIDVWKCPFCNYEEAITILNNRKDKNSCRGIQNVNKRVVEKWGTKQMSFFGREKEKISLNVIPTIDGEQCCPKCHRVSTLSTLKRNVSIQQDNLKIVIKAEIYSLEELVSIPWTGRKSMVTQFPLYEILTFNFKTGKSYVEIQDKNDVCVAKRDITYFPNVFEKCILSNLIINNVFLSRTLKRIFAQKFDEKLPFEKNELSIEKYILMTRFVGFPRSFYDSIPFVCGSLKIDKTFCKIANQLHTTDGGKKLFDKSQLPKCKSVKKNVFSKVGLLFYLHECECFWRIIQDVNCFCKLISSEYIFDIVSLLHKRPMLFDFLYDFARVKSVKKMVELITKDWVFSTYYATDYCTMSEPMKLEEQKLWLSRNVSYKKLFCFCVDGEFFDEDNEAFECYRNSRMGFSIPMKSPIEGVCNCNIDGFSFVWLRCGSDYFKAGVKLKNCLTRWKSFDNPVVVVKQNEKIVAAIEVGADCVKQVRGYHNTSITDVVGLPDAYNKWLKKFGLKDIYHVNDMF